MKLLTGFDTKDRLLVKAAIVILVCFCSIFFFYNKNQKLKKEIARNEINYKAALDSVRATTAKDGSVEYDKLSYIVEDLKELKKINKELAAEVAATKGKVFAIEKIGVKIVHDTIPILVDKPVIVDGVALIRGHFDTTYSTGNYRRLATETKYNLATNAAEQLVTKDEIGFTAVTGIKSTSLGYEIFLRPKYPGMTVTHLEGALVEKNFFAQPKSKTPLITIGGSIGYQPFGYDLNSKKLLFTPTRVGGTIGLNFNINRR
jgi:hypothetical protein